MTHTVAGGRIGAGCAFGPRHIEWSTSMVTYIGLLKFTDKGLQSIKQTTQRAAAAKEVATR